RSGTLTQPPVQVRVVRQHRVAVRRSGFVVVEHEWVDDERHELEEELEDDEELELDELDDDDELLDELDDDDDELDSSSARVPISHTFNPLAPVPAASMSKVTSASSSWSVSEMTAAV